VAEVEAALTGPLALEKGLPPGLGVAELAVRTSYLRSKKLPQLRWMLHHVRALLEARRAAAGVRRMMTVIDLGCGKGDLTLLLAAALRRSVHVLGVDTNASAITTARERAKAAGLHNVCFRQADATELLGGGSNIDGGGVSVGDRGDVGVSIDSSGGGCGENGGGGGDVGVAVAQAGAVEDMVEDTAAHLMAWHVGDGCDQLVALHACGGLSDVALRLAAQCGASCLIATCCFGKHRELCPASAWSVELREEQKDVLCRMADCVEPSVAEEARALVGNMRLEGMRRNLRAGVRVRAAKIRSFDDSYSRQNVVLECETCEAGDDAPTPAAASSRTMECAGPLGGTRNVT
jgi:hypothetical protein